MLCAQDCRQVALSRTPKRKEILWKWGAEETAEGRGVLFTRHAWLGRVQPWAPGRGIPVCAGIPVSFRAPVAASDGNTFTA